jgi:hypothetical protein
MSELIRLRHFGGQEVLRNGRARHIAARCREARYSRPRMLTVGQGRNCQLRNGDADHSRRDVSTTGKRNANISRFLRRSG